MAARRSGRKRELPPANSEVAYPSLYMEGVEYFQCRFAHPFLVRAPLGEHWLLYRVAGESIVFSASDAARTAVTLEKGAILALSGVLQHQFASPGTGQIARPWTEEPYSGQAAPGEALLHVGRISKSQMAVLPMYERLLIIQPSEHPAVAARFGKALDWIGDELTLPGAPSKEIIRRLAEIVTIEIGRFEQHMDMDRIRVNPKNAADLRVIRAISAFYSEPQEPWSVQKLADVAGMSRTAFAVRYRALIGATPLRTIRHLRMQLANNQLSQPVGYPKIENLARTAGYGSGAAFIRAYFKEFGVTPGKTRLDKKKP